MPAKYASSIDALASKEDANTHHIRLKCAAELFQTLRSRYDYQQSANITCELLKISRAGLDHILKHDPLKDQKKHYRDLQILKLRASGYSPRAISGMTGLSRVQVWRVIRDIEQDVTTIKTLQRRKIRAVRLKYNQMPSDRPEVHCRSL